MPKINDFYNTKSPISPLDYAQKKRKEPVIDTVTRAIARRNVLLAYQPIVHSSNPLKPAFYEGLIRIMDDTREIIPARDFISIVGLSVKCDILWIYPGVSDSLVLNLSWV